MGEQVVVQPDGRLAVFSSVEDQILVWDATEDEVIERAAENAAEYARVTTRMHVENVRAGRIPRPFGMTWERALAADEAHGGDAWRYFQGAPE